MASYMSPSAPTIVGGLSASGSSVTREYRVPRVPTFISGAADPTMPPLTSSAEAHYHHHHHSHHDDARPTKVVTPTMGTPRTEQTPPTPRQEGDAAEGGQLPSGQHDDPLHAAGSGWCLTQNPQDTTYVMHNVVDNIMQSTNGNIGVKHRSETQTAVLRSYVMMNRVYHRVPLTQELRSLALPSTDEVGAVVCVVDLNVFVNDEPCTLHEMHHRTLSMRDACYRCGCVIGNGTGELFFKLHYRRFVSLHALSQWAAELWLDEFVVCPDTAPGTTFDVTVVAELSVDNDSWLSSRTNGMIFPDPPEDEHEAFESTSLTSGACVRTKSWAWASVRFLGEDRSTLTETRLKCSTANRAFAEGFDGTAHMPSKSPITGNSDDGSQNGFSAAALRELQFQGPDPLASAAFSSSECDNNTTPLTGGGTSSRKPFWVLSRRYEWRIVAGQPLPDRISLSLLTDHVSSPPSQEDANDDKISSSPRSLPAVSSQEHPNSLSDAPAPGTWGLSTTQSSFPSCPCQLPKYVKQLLQTQRSILDQVWAGFDADIKYQDALHPIRLTLALRYGAFTAFCSGFGCSQGLSRNALSSPGISMQLNFQLYLYHATFYILTAPESAQRLMRHLCDMLPHAEAHARRMSLSRGALFPHSTLSGSECGSYFLARSPRFHLNADLARVVLLYLEAHGHQVSDEERFQLLELLLEVARVWLEIGEWQDHHTVFRIDEVAGPDDYTGLVEGNFYTHLAVKRQLTDTMQLVDNMKKSSSWGRRTHALLGKLDMSDTELAELKEAADAIVLSRDNRTGVYFAHDHFDSLRTWDGGEMNFPLYLNYHPLVVYRHKLCEIPEVLLGMLIYPDDFEPQDFARNLAYYEPLCTHDTPESLAVVAATHFRAFGDCGKGMHLLDIVSQIDLDNITYTAEDGLHLSAMTSAWMVLVFGIGGLRIVDGTLHLSPSLPVGVSSAQFSLQWRGSTLRVDIVPDHVTYTLVRGSAFRLIHASSTRIHLHEGVGTYTAQLQCVIPRTIAQCRTAHFDGVVFTMESIVENLLEINYQAWCRVLNPFFEHISAQQQQQQQSTAGRHHQRHHHHHHHDPAAPSFQPLTLDEYVSRMIYQEEDRYANYSGLQQVLLARGIELELGSVSDMEIVATRFGLANAKVEELRSLLSEESLKLVSGVVALLEDLKKLGIRVALVSYTRSMLDVLHRIPELLPLLTTMIDGAEVREKQMRGRPHMDIFSKAAKKMHVSTQRCVVVATHLDRGYKENDVRQFLALLDVEEQRTAQLHRTSSVSSASSTHLRFHHGSTETTPLSTSSASSYCSPNVMRVAADQFPRTTAELEDLIVGATRQRRASSVF